MLRVIGVSKTLGLRQVLARVDLTCGAPETAVILGTNGAGKSTLLRVITGLLEADSGDVEVCGASLRKQDSRTKAMIGYVPDSTDAFPDLRVSELVTLMSVLRHTGQGPVPEIREPVIERFGVRPFWRQKVSALSFGQRKRMCLLAAASDSPPLLVLDEPTNGLDPEGVELVHEIIKEREAQGRTTLLSTNDCPFAERVGGSRYVLTNGTLVPASSFSPRMNPARPRC